MENMVNGDFWKAKRVLVTGHTGFKGSWLSLWLQLLGAEVIGYALPAPTRPSLFELANVSQGMISLKGDIRDFALLKKKITEYTPEIIIHLAAQSLVRRSYRDPLETYSTNIMGTVHLLEAIRLSMGVKIVIIVSSDKCYENREHLQGYQEDDPMGGFDPYSSSKGCVELIAAAYRRSFFIPLSTPDSPLLASIASVRAGNVIGGGDWSDDRLIPDIIKALWENRIPLVRNPQAIRPWQHVLEPLHGYLMLAEKLYTHGNEYAGGWNFGPADEDAVPVKWIASQLCRLWGGDARFELDPVSHPHEAGYLKLNSSKARTRLGWRTRLDLEEALRFVIDWYNAYLADPASVRRFTESQIYQYQQVQK